MKILIDALAATQFAGGMTLHAREIILSWEESFPDDEILVITGPSLAQYLRQHSQVTVFEWKNESIIHRAPSQFFGSYYISRKIKPDFTLSLSPIVSPFINSKKSASFQHDWRHLKNPQEFSRINKLYRKLWELSARHAGINFCISHKALEETKSISPRSYSIVVENGRDHARRWPIKSQKEPKQPYIITFGHHNNKRPELTMEAFSLLDNTSQQLVILGARGSYADELHQLADSLGLSSRVHFPGFVDDAEYQALIQNSSVLVMASSDEGFGLPAAEAEYFGIPTVVTEDSGMQTIFDNLLVSPPTAEALALALEEAITLSSQPSPLNEAQKQWTWFDAVTAIRNTIIQKVF